MTNKEIFDRIVTIIQERQGENFVVTEALSLKDDLDADSVDLMEFVLTLEDEFGIEISDEEIDHLQSVTDVIETIKGKYSQKQHASHVVFFICRKKKTLKFLVEIANKETRKKRRNVCMLPVLSLVH